MRRTLPGLNAELAAAVRRVRIDYERIPEDRRPDVFGESWHELEANLDRAAGAGDVHLAETLIENWQARSLRILTPLLIEVEAQEWIRGAGAIADHIGAAPKDVYRLASTDRIPVQREGTRLLARRSDLDRWARSGGGRRLCG